MINLNIPLGISYCRNVGILLRLGLQAISCPGTQQASPVVRNILFTIFMQTLSTNYFVVFSIFKPIGKILHSKLMTSAHPQYANYHLYPPTQYSGYDLLYAYIMLGVPVHYSFNHHRHLSQWALLLSLYDRGIQLVLKPVSINLGVL